VINNGVLSIIVGLLLTSPSILAYNGSDNMSKSNYIEIYNISNSFDLPGLAVGEIRTNNLTGIVVTKDIMATDEKNSQDIKLSLKMPSKPAKIDIVLAMDTSGSMVQSYFEKNVTYLDWASKAIESILAKYPEARVAIVSWDDEVESDDAMTRFYKIDTEKAFIQNELNNLYSECHESDFTIYSIGVKRAIQKLDSEPPIDPHNTARIIIFVTGLSEFRAEPINASKNFTLDYQLANARLNRSYGTSSNFNGYQIYPVQIGIDPRFKWEYDNLSKLMHKTQIVGQPALTKPISVENINDLNKAIDDILIGLKSKPIAYDVSVTDTLYPYFNYTGSESGVMSEKGITRVIPVERLISYYDRPTTLIWNIGNMSGNDEWSALIHTRLLLELPVEVSEERTPVIYNIHNETPVSEIKYTWLTGYRGNISLPEAEILLASGSP
jgi:hypothetical protein